MSGERGKEMQERGWGGFCWEGAAEGCFAAGDGVSAAADPHQPAGMWAHHSAGGTAKWQEMPGALAVAPWQESRFLPCSGVLLVSLTMSVPEPGCVGSGEVVSASALLPPCSHQGWAVGAWGSHHCWLLGWLFHRRSRRAGMKHSDKHPRCKISLAVNIWLLSGILCWKAAHTSQLLCPFQS